MRDMNEPKRSGVGLGKDNCFSPARRKITRQNIKTSVRVD